MDALMLAACSRSLSLLSKMTLFLIHHPIVSFIDDTLTSTATTELS